MDWQDADATGENFTDAWGRVWIREDRHVAALAEARAEGYEGALYSDDEVGLIKGEAHQRGYRQFGPGDRLDGVLDHMAKEIEEARAKPDDASEWADLAILAFDGAQRQGITGQQFIDAYRAKFEKNRSRTWPDWRTAEPGKAIEHVKGGQR
jgi:hypothetical protein